MKASVAAILFALITIIYLQECNAELSDERRIRMSLVQIVHNGKRIQTGAYSTACEKIFTVNTEDVKQYTDEIKGAMRLVHRVLNQGVLDLKVYNAFGEDKYVTYRADNELKIITLMLVEDFTGFMLDERPEPLPIGKEASDNVAQLAGWNKNNGHVIIPVTIKKDNNSKYVYVLLEPFEEERKKIYGGYEMKQGDLLIQSNTIIGFLLNMDTEEKILIFYRAVPIRSTAASSSNRHVSKK